MAGRRAARAVVMVVALGGAVSGVALASPPPVVVRLVAGAAASNITPFSIVPGLSTDVDPNSNASASNPDGLPGGLWDTFAPPLGIASAGQVTVSGLWGEPFVDANNNRRFDDGESFTDDLANTRLDPLSVNRWNGVFMAGFGNDRIAHGVFDPIWARAAYIASPNGPAIAQVSVDFIGRFSDMDDRIVARVHELDSAIRLDALVASATHDHESADTIGLWGPDTPYDGTYPKYLRYVEEKIARTVVDAAHNAQPAAVRYGTIRPGTGFTTLRGNEEDLAGLQSRNSCRTPWVFDDELRAMQLVVPSSMNSGPEHTIATLLNWGTHVESMEGDNLYLSSDYVHTARTTVEEAVGGVAFWVPGAQGAAEIVGDSCRRRWHRDTFDGETFPVTADGTPLALRDIGTDPLGARNRTYAIGRVVGNAAVAALHSRPIETAAALTDLVMQPLDVPVNNEGLGALSAVGVIDKPAAVGGVSAGSAVRHAADTQATPPSGVDAQTKLYAWKIGTADFLTAPGELFPEIYWGLQQHNRQIAGNAAEHFDVVDPDPAALACAARPWSYDAPFGADTGRAFEPSVREVQDRQGTAVHFLLGYTPDLLGYIVPGYDFAWYAAPPADGVGLGALHGAIDGWRGEAPDPCKDIAPDRAFPQVTYGTHYQETNSAGSMLAPAYTCTAWRMLQLDAASSAEGDGACRDYDAWRNALVAHVGVDSKPVCDQSSDTDCVRNR
jgi:hypothetical protein